MDCKHYGKIDGMDPYATSKDFAYIPQEREKLIPLDPEVKLVVNSALCLRTEKFGTASIVEGSFKSIITPDTARLLEELRGKTFTLSFISSEYGIELDTLRNFFANLHKQKVICLYE